MLFSESYSMHKDDSDSCVRKRTGQLHWSILQCVECPTSIYPSAALHMQNILQMSPTSLGHYLKTVWLVGLRSWSIVFESL